MKFGNEFWLILFQEYISPKIFAVNSGLYVGRRREHSNSEEFRETLSEDDR